MRIDPNLVVAPISKDTTDAKPPKASARPSGSTVVSLSAHATKLAEPVDVASRLERIKALLAKGEYPVDLDKLASRIVDDDVARGGTKS